jgi:alpha-galactosidase
MGRIRKLVRPAITSCVLVLIAHASCLCANQTAILTSQSPGKHEITYISGGTAYAEALLNGRLVGRHWGTDRREGAANSDWDDAAFEIRIKDVPTPPTMPGKLLSSGWRWAGAEEIAKTGTGARHYVVKLSNSIMPIDITVHTLLDGTPVLTRYLEITNNSRKSVALTELSPWSGRLWSVDAPVSLGHSLRSQQFWEGWFGWTKLQPGTNTVEERRGLAYDDPYFVLHNETKGEYFFGELAWPANYLMEFQNTLGLTFKVGPTAVNALRVIAAGETVATPALHLGFIRGDFDASVQAMHEHIRRSVLPALKPELLYLSQYLINEDWQISVYRSSSFNEANMKKAIDVAAAAGFDVFILDGPMWMSTYGDWLVPNKGRFPNGLAPLVDYAHRKGMRFGLYAETEGGRDGATSEDSNATVRPYEDSKVYQEHPDWFVKPGDVLNLSVSAAAADFQSVLFQMVDQYRLVCIGTTLTLPSVGRVRRRFATGS